MSDDYGMRKRMKRSGAAVALSVFAVGFGAFGCSSSSGGGTSKSDAGSAPGTTKDGASGTGDATSTAPAEPSVYIASTLGPTTYDAGTNACPVTTAASPFLSIGSTSAPVPNAGTAGVNTVAVSCTVMAAGAGRYSLDLSVYDGNVSEITISGSITDTPGAAQSGISATFSESGGATGTSYSQSTCTLTLNAAQPTPVASGRIWATLDCPAITNVVNDATCDATATFLFENCIE